MNRAPRQPRNCEVCGCADREHIYSQRFVPIDGASPMDGYDVVVCKGCGFGYADGIPDQAAFDAYYRDLSKYEPNALIPASGRDNARFEEAAELVLDFAQREARILEIGCADGTLLGILKRAGFRNVVGIDPSPACAEAAKRQHDVPVVVGSLFSAVVTEHSFDMVITMGVLEHIRDLGRAMARICSFLADEGTVVTGVPDATRLAAFPDAPFQEFSVEHINFFSLSSLANLLRRFGLGRIRADQRAVSLGGGAEEPVIYDVSRRVPKLPPAQPRFDASTGLGLVEYVRHCREMDRDLRNRIERLVSGSRPLVVWGVGTHTQRLLANTKLGDARIVAFVDSNPHYQGRTLNGVPIVSPEAARERSEPILVSSRACQAAIVRQIQRELRLPNELLTLYDRG
jgi:SAM-dependent methyltransferase